MKQALGVYLPLFAFYFYTDNLREKQVIHQE